MSDSNQVRTKSPPIFILSKNENSVTKMSNYYKVWIKSESYYWMKVKTPDNISEENVRSNFRKFDSECFDPDDVGTWDLDSVTEIDEDEFDETKMYHCKWEDRNQ